jgi:hypothetical protein
MQQFQQAARKIRLKGELDLCLFLQYKESLFFFLVEKNFWDLLIAEDGELWEYFSCPFCYIEVEVPFICNHLQEEHCFDTRNAVSTPSVPKYKVLESSNSRNNSERK